MPPVSQQSSRAGLITAVVIFTILTLVFIGTTFYCNSQWQNTEKQRTELLSKYGKVATESDLNDPGIVSLQQANKDLGLPANAPAIQTAMEEIKRLVATIQGTPGDASAGMAAAQAALNNAHVDLIGPDPSKDPWPYGVQVPMQTGLTGVIAALDKGVIDRSNAAQAALQQSQEAQAQLVSLQGLQKAELAKRDQDVAAANAKVQELQQKLAAAADAQTKAVADATANAQKTVEDNGKQLQTLVQQIQASDQKIASLNRQIESYKNLIAQRRWGPEEVMVRQEDGRITRLPAPGVAFINLGSADHITPGLTFEVYDHNTGVPGLGDGVSNEGMPIGKGSIEVIHVGQNSSECRVVSTKTGETLSEGDIIANLVYDKNTKYNFFVFGDFDPDQSGIWSAQKAAVIKDLVKRWGGNVVDHIGPDTDFVVVGREPPIPNFSKDDLDSNPIDRHTYELAVAAQKKYDQIVEQAKDLHIPVMNQNRFLYYTGYFDMAKR